MYYDYYYFSPKHDQRCQVGKEAARWMLTIFNSILVNILFRIKRIGQEYCSLIIFSCNQHQLGALGSMADRGQSAMVEEEYSILVWDTKIHSFSSEIFLF